MTDSQPLDGLRIGLLTDWMSLRGGGIPPVVLAQADLIASQGGDARIFALADPHTADEPRQAGEIPITLARVRGSDRFGYAPALVPSLLDAKLDLLHLHGIWMYPSRAALRWKRTSGRPLVLSSHGMLSPWLMARGKLQKFIARHAYLDANLKEADLLHALTASELADYARESGRGDTVIIPNPGPTAIEDIKGMPPANAVFIGRFHSKKNLLALIEGWSIAELPEGARLIVAGFGTEADTRLVRAAVDAAGPSVELREAVYGPAKAELLASARFVVLPSHSEGLPIAILEAWAAGIPTIQTPACNLPEGIEAGAALPCGYAASEIATALEQAFACGGDQWRTMSRAANILASGPFSPAAVTGRWIEAYRDLVA